MAVPDAHRLQLEAAPVHVAPREGERPRDALRDASQAVRVWAAPIRRKCSDAGIVWVPRLNASVKAGAAHRDLYAGSGSLGCARLQRQPALRSQKTHADRKLRLARRFDPEGPSFASAVRAYSFIPAPQRSR